jgi:hypothetical protein
MARHARAPLQDIHDYRNRIVHGRVVPELVIRNGDETVYVYPKLDTVDSYLDWRVAFADVTDPEKLGTSFMAAQSLGFEVWKQTVTYVETSWRIHLLPALAAHSA